MIKRETDSWLNSFMWEPNILTDLLDFEPRIFPEKYAFFSSKILLVVVIEELTEMDMWNLI